jgi:hypothetical protein
MVGVFVFEAALVLHSEYLRSHLPKPLFTITRFSRRECFISLRIEFLADVRGIRGKKLWYLSYDVYIWGSWKLI